MPRSTNTPIAWLLGGLLCFAAGYVMVLVAGPPAAGAAPGATVIIAAWALALGASLVLAAMLGLAAARPQGTPRALRATVRLVFAATFGGLAYALAAPAPAADGPLLLGLPRVTAVMLLVTGLIPLVVLPLAYARAFDRDVLGQDDIGRMRGLRAAADTATGTATGTGRDA